MCEMLEIEYLDIEPNNEYEKIIKNVLTKCYEVEKINPKYLYVNIILTNPENIRKFNKEYRNIDSETDVLSFPMFEKEELENFESAEQEVLGDIIISIDRVEKQADEYGHSFQRELSYMVVHGFYHIIGYDHMEEADKKIMRVKEENILEALEIGR